MPAAQEFVEFCYEQIERFVSIIGSDGRHQVGTTDFHMALRRELSVRFRGLNAFEIEADANDAAIATQQASCFFERHLVQGGTQLQMDATNDDTVCDDLGSNFGFQHSALLDAKNRTELLTKKEMVSRAAESPRTFSTLEYFVSTRIVHLMKRLILLLALLSAPLLLAQNASADFEKEIAAVVAGPQVTVVHFWAPWCPNCRAEMGPDGWAKFVEANPKVQVVFIAI